MSRGPIPDKPSDRPTVPEVADKLRAYRTLPNRYVGGCVHVIVEDCNVSQDTADWCLARAEAWAHEWGGAEHVQADVEIARLLSEMTVTQRRKLSAMNTYPGHAGLDEDG